MTAATNLDLVDASVADLAKALNTQAITSVELVSLYLHRIGKYDCRGPSLNSVCVLNPRVFEEAQASDDYRASGRPPRPLEGIPYTVKDSFRVKGTTVAAGSPAFADLVAPEDAAIVESLRAAGAILLGKTTMPPMADGGSQRGLYGRAESPYNPIYSTTAYASGSSNGCGTSTTASFAAFGFAGETVSSGRSPASNNALVGYSPSSGVIPNRGQWPLYPTCDVIVPHTRSMQDLFDVLSVIVADDTKSLTGLDFWRNQKFIQIPKSSEVRPTDYHSLEDPKALEGKRIAVPRCFLGNKDYEPFHMCSDSVLELWRGACADLEALGATIVETDFPMLEQYTKKDFPGQGANVPGMTREWMSIERCEMIATAWDDFLREQGDEKYPNFPSVNPDKIHPLIAPMDDPSKHTEAQNQVRYSEMMDAVRERKGTIYDLPGCEQAVKSLAAMRKQMYEAWMDSNGFDLVAFPTNGDVAWASPASRSRWAPPPTKRCLHLLRSAFAYEAGSQKRTTPPLAPPLPSDSISLNRVDGDASREATPILTVESALSEKEEDAKNEVRLVSASGTVGTSDSSIQITSVSAYVNGEPSDSISFEDGRWSFKGRVSFQKRVERFPTVARVPKDQFMVVIVAKASNGRCAARLLMID
ncbi:glu asp-tRNA amidotransferase subunit A [Fusarium albosuccineum]|uniref:Glu asp-tRNA amidotransferase subunit A n=1 Tax=Fusarium albosuccineum TaxID=1237068 RepID=A0A8H4LIM3_9HYPO|nr:glu asp-tRNA amidotransferase subunit A [Fusarium albosuccineum]